MIKSMTGYGKAEVMLETGKLIIEIRSLNGKNADISLKSTLLPKDKEIIVRQLVAAELQRGNIDIFVNFEANAAESAKKINSAVLKEYMTQIQEARKIPKDWASMNSQYIGEAIELMAVLRLPDVVDCQKQEIITDDNWTEVYNGFASALKAINEFRAKEGEILYKDVTAKVANILEYSRQIEQYEKERTEAIREKILSRFEELQLAVDSNRLEQEMIFYLEKLDINEEKVRLRQHCKYFMDTIDNEPNPGKKLGFIAQEMGREINTTGSKSNHTEMQILVVKMKDELEKIKEQSLNIL